MAQRGQSPKSRVKVAMSAPQLRRSNGLPVRELKTSERVALDVVRDIVAQSLETGDRLPTETEMLEQYGVSRESLREALRLLEVQGLITLKRGPGGGPFVGGVDPVNLARTATLFFHLAGATYDELFDTWLHTEPLLTEMAARNPNRALVREAMEPFLVEPEGDDSRGFAQAASSFHDVVPTLADNRVLTLLMSAAGCIVVEHMLLDLDPLQIRDTIGHDHVALARAISAGHAVRARQLSHEHISHIVEYYRAHHPDRMKEPIEWR